MVTLVGTQADFIDVLKELLELEYDTVEVYNAAINRLQKAESKKVITSFKDDHERHVAEITQLLERNRINFTHGPSGKQALLIGNIALSKFIGKDVDVLKVLLSAEADTNTAYERMLNHTDKLKSAEELLRQCLQDERRHKKWLTENVDV